MPRTPNDPARLWQRARWPVVLALLVAIISLVPPGTLPFSPSREFSDAAIAHWPNAFFLRQSVLQRGEWPFWNPLRMLGQPFAANPLTKVWYPPQWLALIVPPTLHLDILLYAHIALLGLGMIVWAREEGLRPLAAVFAALAWGLNPRLIAHLGAGHLDIVYALAWVPWLLWAMRRVVAWPTIERGVALAGVAALLALADLRVAFYMIPLAVLYGLVVYFASPAGDPARPALPLLGAWGLAGGLFLLLTAVQTVPLLAIGPRLTRALITPQDAAIYSLPPRYLLGLLIADGGGFHEWMVYPGLPVIVLALLALRDRGRRMGVAVLWGGVLIAILWAFGEHGPLFMPLARLLPFVSWFRVPSRAWFVVSLSLVLLSAWGLDGLLRDGLGSRGRLAALALGFGGLVWTLAVLAVMPSLPGNVIGAGLALLGTGVGVWLAGGGLGEVAGGRRAETAGLGLLLATLAISLLLLDNTLVEGRSLAAVDAHDEALIAALGPQPGLVYSPSFDLIGPAAARASLRTLHGVDPFQLRSHAALIAQAAGVELSGYSVLAPPLPADVEDIRTALQDVRPDYDLLSALGVEWIVARFPLEGDRLRLHARVGESYVYRLEPDRTPSPPPCCLEGEYRPTADLIGLTVTGATLAALAGLAIWKRRRAHVGA